MGNPIPESSRRLVEQRQAGLCARCGGRGTEMHHRRSRSVRGPFCHAAGNLVLLCGTCHRWAHAHPVMAREAGLILRRHVEDPATEPMSTLGGTVLLDHEGGYEFLNP